MRMRTLLTFLLIAALLLGLTACGQARPGSDASGTLPPALQPDGTQAAAPETTEGSALPRVQGADSVKTLLEKSLDYLHSGCDHSKIADVHDQQANMAFLLVIMLYDSDFATETVTEITWDQAMERAALLFEDAETLREKDPELAQKAIEWCDARDPAELVTQFVENLRESFRNGTITEEHPNYEKLSQLLADADKGADYIWEHYPEVFKGMKESGIIFGLDGALEKLRKYASMEAEANDLAHFKDLQVEYRPENSEPGRNGGIYSYDMGSLIDGHSTWGIDMLYYVDHEVYYLIGYTVVVGGTGG